MIFLTGATGFVGSYLLLELLQSGKRVRTLRRSNSKTGQVDRVFNTFSSRADELLSRVEWVEGDILDVYPLQEVMDGIEEVVHCAGMVSFHPEHKHSLMETNVEGTANLVNISLLKGIRRFVYVSSIAALGRGGEEALLDENTVWKHSRLNSRYAVSKYGGEREVWRGKEEGLPVIVVNPAIILGYGDPAQSSTRMFENVKKGLSFYPCGTNGFVDVRDVSRAVSLLINSDIRGERFILSAVDITYKELFRMIASEINKKPPSTKAGPWMAGSAWRWEWLKSRLTGVKPLLTRETAITSAQDYHYDGSKITRMIPFTYTPIEETIRNTGELIKKDFNW
ncbi:MAG: NAD-dependent epimerase/dehydratase family protein [Bacteroidetes bacterium]|nr:NAD-dependent epimerase/dehydratase family protein [Bacteroidota bacterium]